MAGAGGRMPRTTDAEWRAVLAERDTRVAELERALNDARREADERVAQQAASADVLRSIGRSPADLSFAYGVDFLTGIHPPVEAAIERMISICRTHGIASGLGETSIEALERWRERGCTFLAYGPD